MMLASMLASMLVSMVVSVLPAQSAACCATPSEHRVVRAASGEVLVIAPGAGESQGRVAATDFARRTVWVTFTSGGIVEAEGRDLGDAWTISCGAWCNGEWYHATSCLRGQMCCGWVICGGSFHIICCNAGTTCVNPLSAPQCVPTGPRG